MFQVRPYPFDLKVFHFLLCDLCNVLRDTFYLATKKIYICFKEKQVFKHCEFNSDAKKLRLACNVSEDCGAGLSPSQHIFNDALLTHI